MSNLKHGMGLRSLHDPNYDTFEKLYVDEKSLPPVLPSVLDYRVGGDFPAIDQQGSLGSCTAFAARKQFEFYRHRRTGNKSLISARALFAAARAEFDAGDTTDSGLNCSDPLNILMQYYVNESDYSSLPDDSESDFKSYLKVAPVNLHKTDFLVKSIATVNNDVLSIKRAIFSHGILMMGINFANSWFNPDANGVLPFPDSVAGGHAMTVVGFDDTIECPDGTRSAALIANNWGTSWSVDGYCYLPFSYINIQDGQFWPTDLFTIIA